MLNSKKQRKKFSIRLTDEQVIDHLLANNWERGWISQSTIATVRKQMEAKLRSCLPSRKPRALIPGDYD